MTMRRFTRNPVGFFKSPQDLVLKQHNIEWSYFTHEGQLAFGFQKFAIHWEPSLKLYVIKVSGEIVYSDIEMARCLDMAPSIIFDNCANQITNPKEATQHG